MAKKLKADQTTSHHGLRSENMEKIFNTQGVTRIELETPIGQSPGLICNGLWSWPWVGYSPYSDPRPDGANDIKCYDVSRDSRADCCASPAWESFKRIFKHGVI